MPGYVYFKKDSSLSMYTLKKIPDYVYFKKEKKKTDSMLSILVLLIKMESLYHSCILCRGI